LLEGKKDEDLVYKKKIRRPLVSYTKTTPPHIRAARLLGSRTRSVEYVMTLGGPIPTRLEPRHIDYKHYIDKQLTPVADSLLKLLGTSLKEILDVSVTGESVTTIKPGEDNVGI